MRPPVYALLHELFPTFSWWSILATLMSLAGLLSVPVAWMRRRERNAGETPAAIPPAGRIFLAVSAIILLYHAYATWKGLGGLSVPFEYVWAAYTEEAIGWYVSALWLTGLLISIWWIGKFARRRAASSG
jgi:hypothetical protein